MSTYRFRKTPEQSTIDSNQIWDSNFSQISLELENANLKWTTFLNIIFLVKCNKLKGCNMETIRIFDIHQLSANKQNYIEIRSCIYTWFTFCKIFCIDEKIPSENYRKNPNNMPKNSKKSFPRIPLFIFRR